MLVIILVYDRYYLYTIRDILGINDFSIAIKRMFLDFDNVFMNDNSVVNK